MRRYPFFAIILIVLLVTQACSPTPGSPSDSSGDGSQIWFVSPVGSDEGKCSSLETACHTITAALAKAADGDSIIVAAGIFSNEVFTISEGVTEGLWIAKSVSIQGSGSFDTVIEANGQHSGVVIPEGVRVTISGVSIQGAGGASPFGVIVLAGGNLTLENSRVSGNSNIGIWTQQGEVTLNSVQVLHNGAGIVNTTATAAGILNENGTIQINNSLVDNNLNGGIFNAAGGTLEIFSSTISNNSGGLAGFTNLGNATIEKSTFSGNLSTFLTGPASGVDNRGTLTITNSTISGNQGTGVSNINTPLTLNHVTIAGNATHGLHAGTSGVTLHNTLIAFHPEDDCSFSGQSSLETSGTNIDTDGSCGVDISAAPADLPLGPLDLNGGSTQSHALPDNSPAINAASGACPSDDQRAVSRPQQNACDIGAYESDSVTADSGGSQENSPAPDEPTPTATATLAATSTPFPPALSKTILCWAGPGPAYDVVSSIQAGEEVVIVGRGAKAGWYVIDNPVYPGVNCWVEEDELFNIPEFPIDFPIIPVPDPPTPTPTITPTVTPCPGACP